MGVRWGLADGILMGVGVFTKDFPITNYMFVLAAYSFASRCDLKAYLRKLDNFGRTIFHKTKNFQIKCDARTINR